MSKRTFDEMSSGGQATGLPPMTASLLESGMWSDLKIKCKDRTWKVHRLVVGLQSKPLGAALNGEFKEAQSGIIQLDDHDPEIVGYMINFLYSGDYTILQPKPEKAEKPEKTEESEWPDVQQSLQIQTLASEALVIHTAVYLIADEKDIPALKMLAKKKYEATLPHGWNSAQFCTTLKMIWDGTPENDTLLWDSAASYAGKKAKELMDHGEFATLCKENAEIGFAIFRSFVNTNPDHLAPVYLRPEGCPFIGVRHAASVGKGRKGSAYFCYACSKNFN